MREVIERLSVAKLRAVVRHKLLTREQRMMAYGILINRRRK